MTLAQQILKRYWGFDSFRNPQELIIESVLSGKDTLALLPTGGGKSICFQVPGMAFEGLTVVISPLIALMQDQVDQLRKRGIPALEVNSSLGWREIDRRLNLAVRGQLKFLYCAPERLNTDLFLGRLCNSKISLLAIDEAHCVSQWGYDFRPSYMQIADFRNHFPDVPMIALTASATPKVQEDIISKLGLKRPQIFTKSFRRENLSYRILKKENIKGEILSLVGKLKGSGIVYARTRKRVEKLAEWLNKNGHVSMPYHGGMESSHRASVQEKWIQGAVPIITATNAFGMGIDKPDVRWVIHYNLPGDIESYYQEAGRGGRDGEKAWSFAFHHEPDIRELEQWTKEKYPEFEDVKSVYEEINRFYRIPDRGKVEEIFQLESGSVSERLGFSIPRVDRSLKVLHDEGLLAINESPDSWARVQFLLTPQEVRKFMNRNPSQTEQIEYLLRTLGGEAFTEEVNIYPARFFKKMKGGEEAGLALLSFLKDREILQYKPPMSKPTIRFFEPFRNLRKTDLNWEKYAFLQTQANEKLNHLIAFAQENKRCRTQMICAYFGEKNAPECGICDTCLKRAQLGMGKEMIQKITNELREAIQSEGLPYPQLKEKIKSGAMEQREKVLRYLIEEKVFTVDENAVVFLNPKDLPK